MKVNNKKAKKKKKNRPFNEKRIGGYNDDRRLRKRTLRNKPFLPKTRADIVNVEQNEMLNLVCKTRILVHNQNKCRKVFF